MVSVIINSVLTILLFFVVFGGRSTISVWGGGGWVLDFVPQSFMIALMSSLVPGFLAERKVRAGAVATISGATRLPRNLLARALLLAVAATLLGMALVVALAFVAQRQSLAFGIGLALKVAYGAGLAMLVTPVALRATLARA